MPATLVLTLTLITQLAVRLGLDSCCGPKNNPNPLPVSDDLGNVRVVLHDVEVEWQGVEPLGLRGQGVLC